ncbi:MAG: M18 family aminopeptidase [Planctomycetota bacterium]
MVEPHFRQTAQQLLNFIESSPTPFHCVATLKKMFRDQGFLELFETDSWALERGGKYFLSRQGGTFCAFIMGTKPTQEAGVRIIGAHTDSPNLRLKPNAVYTKAGYIQVGVEVYGGVLLGSWTDRDLAIAGRVLSREEGKVQSRLLRIDRPIARVSQLAIHLNRKVNEDGLILNMQTHLPPLLGIGSETLSIPLILEQAGVKVSGVLSHDLQLYDTQKPVFSGLQEDFIHSPRLDNQAMCFASASSLIKTHPESTAHTRVIACFDHEEIGSTSTHGANSTFLRDILERFIIRESYPQEAYFRSIAKSFFVSADMAHAVHPNYEEYHEPRHKPVINGGPVVKINESQRYASTGETAGIFVDLCKQAEVPYQHFITRSDIVCGSTIGPMTTAKLGIRGVDVGNPMISMHSIREMAGSKDPYWMEKVFNQFFQVPQIPDLNR